MPATFTFSNFKSFREARLPLGPLTGRSRLPRRL